MTRSFGAVLGLFLAPALLWGQYPEPIPDYGTIPGSGPIVTTPGVGETTYRTVYPVRDVDFANGRRIDFNVSEVFSTYRVWAGAEASIWWFKKSPVAVPLATTSASSAGNAGFLNDPQAVIILGPASSIDTEPRGGGRAWLGFWFDPEKSVGLEITGLWLESPREYYGVASNGMGQPLLSRPVLVGGNEAVYDTSYPGSLAGSFNVETKQLLQGLEANLVGFAIGDHRLSLEVLGGFRFLNLEEDMTLRYQVMNLVPMDGFGMLNLPAGTGAATIDSYSTRNRFYGGQLGSRVDWTLGRFSLALSGKIALGMNDQSLIVDGSSQRRDLNGAITGYRGGLLASAANMGTYRESHFSIVPEVGATVGYWVTPRLRLRAGYNILYWSDVIRPGNHVDRSVNPTNTPIDRSYNPNAPVTRTSPMFMRSDFWAEGITFGLDFRF